jgi:ArsR family transcriptional regulator
LAAQTPSLDSLLNALRAAGESTRLRLLAILSRSELSVTELTRILGQSQPRVSRHLKLMCDAHLLNRYREGSWVMYRVADTGPAAHVVKDLIRLMPEDDPELDTDLERLSVIRDEHARKASEYFQKIATRWDSIRGLYVAEEEVERAMLAAVRDMQIDSLVDLGTGTGRILEVFSPRIRKGLGIDLSHEMLSVARAKLESADISHCQVRHGDVYSLGIDAGTVDVATIHHVLHFLDDPASAVDEAVRILRPGGRLLVVDFAPHHIDALREEHAHRRLGFGDDEVGAWIERAGARTLAAHHLTSGGPQSDGEHLVVTLWIGEAAEPGTIQ